MARSQKKINKDHAKNKRVRQEKARLRKRAQKHTSKKYVIVNIEFADPELVEELKQKAKECKMSVEKYISKKLSKIVKDQWELTHGVQAKYDKCLD